MRAELRLLRQPFFFFLLLHFFPITLHIFRTRQLKTVPQTATRKRHLKKGNWRCFKLHRLSQSIFGVSFVKNRRILPSSVNSGKGKELKLSFAFKSKIRKFQVVLKMHKTQYRMFVVVRPSHQRSCRRYCIIFPVGSDNAKEGYRLRTSIGRPAPRGTGVLRLNQPAHRLFSSCLDSVEEVEGESMRN